MWDKHCERMSHHNPFTLFSCNVNCCKCLRSLEELRLLDRSQQKNMQPVSTIQDFQYTPYAPIIMAVKEKLLIGHSEGRWITHIFSYFLKGRRTRHEMPQDHLITELTSIKASESDKCLKCADCSCRLFPGTASPPSGWLGGGVHNSRLQKCGLLRCSLLILQYDDQDKSLFYCTASWAAETL